MTGKCIEYTELTKFKLFVCRKYYLFIITDFFYLSIVLPVIAISMPYQVYTEIHSFYHRHLLIFILPNY
jgi:hypothetical protein